MKENLVENYKCLLMEVDLLHKKYEEIILNELKKSHEYQQEETENFSLENFEFNEKTINNLLTEILYSLKKYLPKKNIFFSNALDISKIENYIKSKSFNELFKIISNKKEIKKFARTLNLKQSSFAFIIFNLIKPYFKAIAKIEKDRIKIEKKDNFCPFCKTKPNIAYIQKDTGKRFLICPLCGTSWEFARIKCPFCGNEDQRYLGFFIINDDYKFRVDYCKKCKGYIKTLNMKYAIDENIEFTPELLVELDIAAEKEGFIMK